MKDAARGADWESFHLPVQSDERGNLVALESPWPLPFEIRRIFYIYGAGPDKRRGCHAHVNTREVLVCQCGSCTITLDNGRRRETIALAGPGGGLTAQRMVWIELSDFSADCILLVAADRRFLETESIGDYSRFIEIKTNMETDRNAR